MSDEDSNADGRGDADGLEDSAVDADGPADGDGPGDADGQGDSAIGADGHGDADGHGSDRTDVDEFEPDPERVALLREIADEIRGDSSERKQLANVLYRVSDIYDPDEETTPEDVVRNVKFILEVKERGGLRR